MDMPPLIHVLPLGNVSAYCHRTKPFIHLETGEEGDNGIDITLMQAASTMIALYGAVAAAPETVMDAVDEINAKHEGETGAKNFMMLMQMAGSKPELAELFADLLSHCIQDATDYHDGTAESKECEAYLRKMMESVQ